ncbi:hypothetical protein QR680_015117 [Steinernema hermaphroditum]|uniref:Myosin motor domain-containing protein n=1 Tax=Steinernema hermaphroditum TaxID=289476 RepID=A0AA39IDE8_9BILA|nr:hypothetical protein QR680_015117 [Steinernema hermaphroditum]
MPSTVNLEWLQDPGWVYLRQHDDELLKEQAARNFDNKTHTWVANAVEGFVLCEQSIVEGKQLTVKLPDGTMKKVNRDECQEINPAKYEKTEDMSNLTYLNEASVLHNLRQRYKSMMIYTYSGLFCVFINPYKLLPIYTESVMNMYVGRRRSEMPPHLFAVSDQAYRNMIHDHENQSMLITGESGAGKTENTKKVIAYFAQIGAPPKDKKLKKSVSFSDQVKGSLEDQVVQANPAIEAFGNATTNRNLNSSRFGKFIRIHFNSKGKLAGGDIAHYSFMLESDIRKYHFVSQAEVKIEQIDDVEEFKITDSAFDVMGFSKEEKTDLYKLCAAIMHLGEMKFKHKPREEQAEVDNVNSAKNACHLFGINVEKFIDSLLKPTVKVGTEWVTKGQTVQQVDWAVGGLAKAIYARMFSWLIERCNQTLGKASDEHSNYIGVLDIAGFEIFDRNSFEQLWINFVNEKLQQFFNHHMFVLEQEEYQREGIKWQFIDFGHDLQHCIDLIEKPLGIVSMLDEECIVPKATDMTYIEKLKAQHLDKHPNFQNARPPKGKQAEAHFSIVHYAGIVRYNAEQWLEKNKDPLNDSAVAVLKTASKESLIFKIWESYKTAVDNEEDAARGKTVCRKKGKAASFLTVSVMYRESLNSLMHMLNSTHPHFIRCIIPNEKKQSGLIDAPLVLNQLTCNGVLEGIRICRKGFPNRVTFADFRYRYAVLAADEASQNKDPAQSSQKMLDRLVSEKRINVDTFRVGSTKVFFKAGQLAKLEEMRDVALTGIIVKLQSVCRAHMALCRHQQLHKKRAAIAAIQRNVRSWIALRVWPWYKLYQRVKPMIGEMKASKAELEALEQKIKEIETEKQKEVDERGKLQDQLNKQLESNENLRNTIEMQKSDAAERQKEMENLKDLLEQEKANALKAAKLSSVKENNELEERRKVRVELEDTRLAFANSEANLHETKAHLELQKDANTKMQIRNKALEHSNNELMDTMQLTQTKLERTEQQKSQLQEQLEETEKKLRLEKKQKEEQNKLRKKQEAELKLLQDQLELIQKERDYLDQDVKKRDQELSTLKEHSHQDANLISKLQINIRQLVARIEELEEEVDNQTRACRRAERLRTDAQEELNAVTEQMAIANGQLNAQIHLNRSRQNEVNHLHRELEKKNLFHETHIADLCNLQWHTLNNLRSLSVQAQSLELEASRVLGMRKSEPNLAQYNTIADSDEDEETTSHV